MNFDFLRTDCFCVELLLWPSVAQASAMANNAAGILISDAHSLEQENAIPLESLQLPQTQPQQSDCSSTFNLVYDSGRLQQRLHLTADKFVVETLTVADGKVYLNNR